jgi:hypothetical protein
MIMSTERPTPPNGHATHHNLNACEDQVLSEYQKGRPILDADTTAIWNAWFAEGFENHIKRHIVKVKTSFDDVKKEFDDVEKAYNQFVADYQQDRDAAIDAHDQNVNGITILSDRTKELVADLKILDRQVIAEVNKRDMMDTRTIEDLNRMRRDLSGVMDQVRDTAFAIKKIRTNVEADTSDLVKRMDRAFAAEIALTYNCMITKIGEGMNLMRDSTMEVIRGELTEVVLKTRSEMYAEIYDDVRTEMRKEMAAEVRKILNAGRKSKPKPKPQQPPKKKV